jgi:hypothetical protein
VVGYPVGGETVSISSGVVSRVDWGSYAQAGGEEQLTVQIDAAINPGNSGGPAFSNGKVIGVAFQGLDDADGGTRLLSGTSAIDTPQSAINMHRISSFIHCVWSMFCVVVLDFVVWLVVRCSLLVRSGLHHSRHSVETCARGFLRRLCCHGHQVPPVSVRCRFG